MNGNLICLELGNRVGKKFKALKGQNLSWLPGGWVGQRINVTLRFLGPWKQGKGIQSRGLASLLVNTWKCLHNSPSRRWRRGREERLVGRKKKHEERRMLIFRSKEDKVRCTLEAVFWMTEGGMGLWSIFSPQSSVLHGNLCYARDTHVGHQNKGKRGQWERITGKRDEGSWGGGCSGGRGALPFPPLWIYRQVHQTRGRLQWWERYIIW